MGEVQQMEPPNIAKTKSFAQGLVTYKWWDSGYSDPKANITAQV